MKIRQVGAEFHADRSTDIWTEGHYVANRRFPQFCERT